MFCYEALIGLLALGYSTFVRGETNYTYYDERIDSVRFTVEGNVDSQCASYSGVYMYQIQLSRSEELDDDIGFPDKAWDYITCLAFSRKLISRDGSMQDENIKVLQNDMNGLGYFDESITNKAITDCPNRQSYLQALSLNPKWTRYQRVKTQIMYLAPCLYRTIKQFYIEPSRGDFGTREKLIEKAKERSKKAVKLILFKENNPKNMVFSPEDKKKYNDLIDSVEYSFENHLDQDCNKELPNGKDDIDFETYRRSSFDLHLDSSTSKYLTCLALKRNLMNSDGTMDNTSVQNLRKDLESFGYFDTGNVIYEILSSCPRAAFCDRILLEDRPREQLRHLSGCIFQQLRIFYKQLAEGEPYSYPVMWNFTKRVEKATNLILFKLKQPLF